MPESNKNSEILRSREELKERLDHELKYRFGISLDNLKGKEIQLFDFSNSDLLHSLAEFADKEDGFNLQAAEGGITLTKHYDYILDNIHQIPVLPGRYADTLNVSGLQAAIEQLKSGGEYIQAFSLDIEQVRQMIHLEPGSEITGDHYRIAAKILVDMADLELKGAKPEVIVPTEDRVQDVHNVIFKLKTNAS